jgi:hypothetical protein
LDSVLAIAKSDATRAITKIEKQLEALEKTRNNFQVQQAPALILQGAILAAQAPRIVSRTERRASNEEPLDKFKGALAVPGYGDDDLALMLQGEQLRLMEQHAGRRIVHSR